MSIFKNTCVSRLIVEDRCLSLVILFKFTNQFVVKNISLSWKKSDTFLLYFFNRLVCFSSAPVQRESATLEPSSHLK